MPDPPRPLAPDIAAEWALDSSIDYLNHGCFGARTRSVLAAQQAWRDRLEARPVERVDRERGSLLGAAKAAVGALLHMQPDDFGFVTNATSGIDAVLRGLRLEAGDRLVTTSHVYNAVREALRFVAERSGAEVIEAPIPFPLRGADDVLGPLDAALARPTRLVVVDHVTSPTALRLPVETIVERCRARGVPVLVDGAHAPGMLDLDVPAIGATWYAGNLHKWVCAPMGTAFLWTAPEAQTTTRPLIVSHHQRESYAAAFMWQATRDLSGWLAAPAAIEYFQAYGWDAVRRHNHDLAVWAAAHLRARWDVEPGAPDDRWLGSMATLPLPAALRERFASPEALHACLYDEHRIEVPVVPFGDRWHVRVSAQIYNRAEQYERLGEVVRGLAPSNHVGLTARH